MADRVGFHYADIDSNFGPCVWASPHLSVGVPVRGALPANVIAPHSARASGEAHLQSEEIVERLYDTVMPTISHGPAGSAAEEVSACQDALAYSGLSSSALGPIRAQFRRHLVAEVSPGSGSPSLMQTRTLPRCWSSSVWHRLERCSSLHLRNIAMLPAFDV